VYIISAHGPESSTVQRTYTILTQASGCVEDVQHL
jgi:hypothetical protein